jgi:hypothetical protein
METPAKQDSNAAFSIPADVEARLRAQAEVAAASQIDEQAFLAKYTAEALAKREAEFREEAEASLPEGEVQDLDNLGFLKKYVKLTIFKGTSKQDLSYVPVGVNGFVWRIRRGEQVIVHSVVADTLNNAVTEVVLQAEGGLITQPAHRYPYQASPATQEEYDAFKAKMAAEGKRVVTTA